MHGIRVPDGLKEKFEELAVDNVAVQAKYDSFLAAIHRDHRTVAVKAKILWAEAFDLMGLTGEWRYENGMVYPLEKDQKNGL